MRSSVEDEIDFRLALCWAFWRAFVLSSKICANTRWNRTEPSANKMEGLDGWVLDTQFRRATNAKLEGPLDKFHIFIARRVMRCICTLSEIPWAHTQTHEEKYIHTHTHTRTFWVARIVDGRLTPPTFLPPTTASWPNTCTNKRSTSTYWIFVDRNKMKGDWKCSATWIPWLLSNFKYLHCF